MTESEWLACDDPFKLLRCVDSHHWRKRQLLAVAVWDSVRDLWQGDRFAAAAMPFLDQHAEAFDWSDQEHALVEQADEAFTDIDRHLSNRFWNRLVAGDNELWEAVETGTEARLTDWDDPDCLRAGAAFLVAAQAARLGWVEGLYGVQTPLSASDFAPRIEANAMISGAFPWGMWRLELARHADLVREAIRPFLHRIEPIWLAWSDGIIRRLAQGIHDERGWDRLPILGDALEEASCADEAILSHLRSPGPHARGCWALDLVLGKA